MSELQQLILVPAAGTMGITLSVISAMLKQIKTRYSIKDKETGEKLLTHPYKPWFTKDGYEEKIENAYLGYRAVQHILRCLFFHRPTNWITDTYGNARTHTHTHRCTSKLHVFQTSSCTHKITSMRIRKNGLSSRCR